MGTRAAWCIAPESFGFGIGSHIGESSVSNVEIGCEALLQAYALHNVVVKPEKW